MMQKCSTSILNLQTGWNSLSWLRALEILLASILNESSNLVSILIQLESMHYTKLSLVFTLTSIISLMRNLDLLETFFHCFSSKLNYPLHTFSNTSWSVLPLNGSAPLSNINKMTPVDHTSHFAMFSSLLTTSGAT